MYIESNDPEGAKVYDMIIKQIFQDLVLPPSIADMKAYVNPNEVVCMMAIKMRKTSSETFLKQVASVEYDKEEDNTRILINNETYLPNILKKLWFENGRENVHQPSRYVIVLNGRHDIENLVVDNPYENLKRRIYDAIFRIIPEVMTFFTESKPSNTGLFLFNVHFVCVWNDVTHREYEGKDYMSIDIVERNSSSNEMFKFNININGDITSANYVNFDNKEENTFTYDLNRWKETDSFISDIIKSALEKFDYKIPPKPEKSDIKEVNEELELELPFQ